jgi:hypothetical protein
VQGWSANPQDWRLPLTDRVLAALPGSPLAWAIVWSVIVFARPFVASGILLA